MKNRMLARVLWAFVVGGGALVSASSASAALMTFTFTGEYVSGPAGPGTTITGTITYDTSTAPTGGNGTTFSRYTSVPTFSLTYAVENGGGTTIAAGSSTGSLQIDVRDNHGSGKDEFHIVSGANASIGDPVDDLELRLLDETDLDAVSGLDLPSMLAVSAFDDLAEFTLNDRQGLDSIFRLTEITAVPIPAAAWLFGSGLLGLFGALRFRRKSNPS